MNEPNEVEKAVERLTIDAQNLCDGEINAQTVRITETGCGSNDWAVRYVGDTGRDLRLVLSQLAKLKEENERLTHNDENPDSFVNQMKELVVTLRAKIHEELLPRNTALQERIAGLEEGLENAQRDFGNIAFLRPGGPTRSKIVEQMERLAIDARERARDLLNEKG